MVDISGEPTCQLSWNIMKKWWTTHCRIADGKDLSKLFMEVSPNTLNKIRYSILLSNIPKWAGSTISIEFKEQDTGSILTENNSF